MSKILVFGASGQLGQCLKLVSEKRGVSSIAFPLETEANILDLGLLEKIFEAEKPEFIINCAAYTAVDKAEDDVDLCRKINREGAANLAKFCASYGATMVHISTDFVFDGNVPKLLTETDPADPISIYGLTKLEGEVDIIKSTDKYYILRTSWLYSEFANNFVKTMLKLGSERDELSIIADQVGSPTYAIDLADAILDIILSEKEAYGIYHYSNEGITSWFDFAKGIFDISGADVLVHPIPGSAYPTKAKRPAFSVMDKSKIKNTFGIAIPYWRDSLARCIAALKN